MIIIFIYTQVRFRFTYSGRVRFFCHKALSMAMIVGEDFILMPVRWSYAYYEMHFFVYFISFYFKIIYRIDNIHIFGSLLIFFFKMERK